MLVRGRKVILLLLILTAVSIMAFDCSLAKYVKVFDAVNNLQVSFLNNTVNLLRGREMNTFFDPSTEKIVFGATVNDLPSTARLVSSVNKSSYVLTEHIGQTNPEIVFVDGVSVSSFDPLDVDTYGSYRANEAADSIAVYVFFDNVSKTTYFVSAVGNVTYHFAPECAASAAISSVDKFNNFFFNLSHLEDIEIKSGAEIDTSDVQTFQHFFKSCSALGAEALNNFISRMDVSSAYTFSAMFQGTGASDIDLSSWDLSSPAGIEMSYMMREMSNLERVVFPSGNKKVLLLSGNGIKSIFRGCSKIKLIDISNLPYKADTSDSEAFYGCQNLETIVVADDFVHSNVEPNGDMFNNCTKLVGQNGTAYANQDETLAKRKDFAYIDGMQVNGIVKRGYYTSKAQQFTITFNPRNGVSGETTQMSAYVGDEIIIPQSAEPTLSGKKFFGWTLSPSGTVTQYVTGDLFTVRDNVTLYACYEESVFLKTGNVINSYIDNNSTAVVFCHLSELPSDAGEYIYTADVNDAGKIKVYFKDGVTYFAADSESEEITFEFNSDSDGMFLEKEYIQTISHTPSVKISTSSVTTFRNMFKKCKRITNESLNSFISEFDTSSAATFNAMFSTTLYVTELNIEHFYTVNATNFSWMFEDMSALTEINFGPFFDVSNCVGNSSLSYGMTAMFTGCSSLRELDISGWRFANDNISAKYMFRNCSSLERIYSDGSFDYNKINSQWDTDMFKGCTSLVGGNGTAYSSGNIRRTRACIDTAEHQGYFTNISVSGKVRVSFNPNGGISGSAVQIKDYIGTEHTITSDFSPTAIPNHTFAGWGERPGGPVVYHTGDSLTLAENMTLYAIYSNQEIITSATLKTGAEINHLVSSLCTHIVFCRMSDLPAGSVFVGNADEGNCGNIRVYTEDYTTFFAVDSDEDSVDIFFNGDSKDMFYNKTYLETISHTAEININTSNVTDFSNMFKQCRSLTNASINSLISEFDTSSSTSFNAMFSRLDQVTGLDLSGFDSSKVKNFSWMFEEMPILVSIDFGSGFNTSSCVSKTSKDGFTAMFVGCSSLEEIDISGWVVPKNSLALRMFENCTSLTTIYSDGSFDYTKIKTDTDMFKNCTSLIGGNGTVYNSNNTGKTYARIDTAETPGYFTDASVLPLNSGLYQVQNRDLFSLENLPKLDAVNETETDNVDIVDIIDTEATQENEGNLDEELNEAENNDFVEEEENPDEEIQEEAQDNNDESDITLVDELDKKAEDTDEIDTDEELIEETADLLEEDTDDEGIFGEIEENENEGVQ